MGSTWTPVSVHPRVNSCKHFCEGIARIQKHFRGNDLLSIGQLKSVAIEIAQADDAEVQTILQQAYENKLLRGRKLMLAKKLIEQRRRRGKGFHTGSQNRQQPLSSTALVRAYREGVDRKRILIRKANTTRDRLIFITEAMRKLYSEENFITLLRAEGLGTLPQNLANRIEAWAQA